MTTPRADKNAETPPKQPTALTSYAILPAVEALDVVTAHNGPAAVKRWAEDQGADFHGGGYIAVPVRSLKVIQVTVETKRQLTLGTP